MSKELITWNWRASEKTRNTLIKQGWSDKQRKDILLTFIERNLNQEVDQASTKYFNMVRSSGIPHNAPKPDRSEDIKQAKQRAENIKKASPASAEKAKEVKKGAGAMSQDDAKRWINLQRGMPENHGID